MGVIYRLVAMLSPDIRAAVAAYVTGRLSEAEAARCADLPRAQLRAYARTCGSVAPAPVEDGQCGRELAD